MRKNMSERKNNIFSFKASFLRKTSLRIRLVADCKVYQLEVSKYSTFLLALIFINMDTICLLSLLLYSFHSFP